MRINWFKIENFRSIIDSDKCYLDNGITVLAGKNESGKSNILRALESFGNKDLSIDKPQDLDDSVNTAVTISFIITKEELQQYEYDCDYKSPTYEFIVTRSSKYLDKYSGTLYDIFAKELVDTELSHKNSIAKSIKKLSGLTKKYVFIAAASYFVNFKKQVTEYINKIVATMASIDADKQQEVKQIVDNINKEIIECEKCFNQIKEIKESLSKMLPTFVLFDSFDDILPEYITLDQVLSSKIMGRFCKVAKLDAEKLFNESEGQKRKQISDRVSAQISGDFSNYYRQDIVKLKINLDGTKLHFFIYDNEDITPFKPAQRSKGLQWFLSFFLTLTAENNDNSIILIDEPGLFLHAKAQEDVLKVLGNISSGQQVMFTTHSPYLIDPNRLDRVRLVVKDKKNHTKIENKVHKGADKDTMTPIITAIGLDITKNLSFSPVSNILLEGMSDYYYLQGMRKYLAGKCPISDEVNFIPNVGADQIPNMAALLFGWGIDFKILLDGDNKGSQIAKKLVNELRLEEDKVKLVDDVNKHSIEDVFTKEDFNKFVLETEIEGDELNSKKVRSLDKILLAKKLCSKIHSPGKKSIKFTKATEDNFIRLFNKLA